MERWVSVFQVRRVFFLSNRLANVWLIIEKAIKSDFKTGDLKISVGLKCFVSTVLCVENVLSL